MRLIDAVGRGETKNSTTNERGGVFLWLVVFAYGALLSI